MNADLARSFLLTLPHAVETLQWGETLVFWVGDKAIGGKMFALVALDAGAGSRQRPVVSFSAGPEHYSDLLEREDLLPAPYMARIHWVAASCWEALPATEWRDLFLAAHAIPSAKLPSRVQANLALPATQQARLIAARRLLLGGKAAAATRPNPPPARHRTGPGS